VQNRKSFAGPVLQMLTCNNLVYLYSSAWASWTSID